MAEDKGQAGQGAAGKPTPAQPAQPAKPAVVSQVLGAKPAAGQPAAGGSSAIVPAGAAFPEPAPVKKKLSEKLSSMPFLMAINLLLVGFVIGKLMVFKPAQTTVETYPIIAGPIEAPQPVQKGKTDVKPVDLSTTSWKDAEAKFAAKKFPEAAAIYAKLIESANKRMMDESVLTFFQVRQGQCQTQMENDKYARVLFDLAARSPSPIVRAVAQYNLGLQDANAQRYLNARTWAYMAIASLGALEKESPLKADCDFLIARVLTQKVLPALSNEVQWTPDVENLPAYDPFAGLSDSSLQDLLNQGIQARSEASLVPKITRLAGANGGSRYSAYCNQTPLEMFLMKFTEETNEDVNWGSVNQQVRTRAVNLSFRDVSANRLAETACGSVGLIARFELHKTTIVDPLGYSSVKEENQILIEEAKSAWSRFNILHMDDERRIPSGRLAMAMLYEGTKDYVSAMQEYELIAAQHPRDPAAPKALMQLARIKVENLRDYVGATKVLTDLVDRYPNGSGFGSGLLWIADVALKQKQYDNAATNYQRVYYMDISADMNARAALGVGQCMYLRPEKRYEKAIDWLTKFTEIDKNLEKKDKKKIDESAVGWKLLGNCYEGLGDEDNLVRAIESFRKALSIKPTEELKIDINLDLADAYLKAENFLASDAILKSLEGQNENGQQRFKHVLLKSRILRKMHLPDFAISYIKNESAVAVEESQRGWLELEQARDNFDLSELEDDSAKAEKKLEESARFLQIALPKLPANLLETQIAMCDLAAINLKLGNAMQAIAVAEEFLRGPCESTKEKARAGRILADAYVLAGEYEKLRALTAPGSAMMRMFMSGDYTKLPDLSVPTLPETAEAKKEGQ